MIFASLLPLAGVDDVPSGAVLTFLLPLVLVIILAGLWWVSFRRSRNVY